MNHAYRLVWNERQRCYVPAAETTRARRKGNGPGSGSGGKVLARVCAALLTAAASTVYPLASSAGPTGGEVVSGQGSISQTGNTTTISQQSQNLSLNWQQFNIASSETVQFVQPSSSAIALNRVIGNDASQIYGRLSANGRVFLVNPNGVLFAPSAQVDVGGLVASTLNISESDLQAGRYQFTSDAPAPGSVINQGTITATSEGSIALLGGHVSNQGTLRAELGTVALAAGRGVTLDFSGTKLMSVQIDESALGALAENHQLIQADGGTVIMTAAARDALLETVVNNTGVIEARTLQNQDGVIKLLGSFNGGTVNVGGTLDASAPNDGNGGFVETSGAHVRVAGGARITTAGAEGSSGTWLIDPSDYTIGAGGDIDGATLSANLQNGNITIATTQDGNPGDGDILVNDAVTWSSASTLTLTAIGDVSVNAAITNTGSPAGGGVTLRADSEGTCVAGSPACSTVNFGGSGHVTAATVNIHYNPAGSNAPADANGIGPSYTTPTNYSTFVTGTLAASMLVNDVNQLQALNTNLTGRYLLGRDIDAGATLGWNGLAGFTPIGSGGLVGARFTGIFDGAGHTITGLHIDRPSVTGVGLFGGVGASGIVRNVSLVPLVDTSGPTPVVTSFIRGFRSVGGLVGSNTGTLINVTASGSVEAVSSFGGVGGLVGQNTTGTIIGGAVQGPPSGALGSVTGANAGGLVGLGATSSNSHYDVDRVLINGSSQFRPGGFYHDLFQDWIDHGKTLDIARVASLPYDVGSDSYFISTVQGMKDLLGFTDVANYRFTLMADLDLASMPDYYIPSFTAALFDGVGRRISNLSINRPGANDLGLFGIVGPNSTISRVVLSNATVTGAQRVGGLVGTNRGAIFASSVEGVSAISGTNFVGGLVGSNLGTLSLVHSQASVVGQLHTGGLAGLNETGANIGDSYADGEVRGTDNVGGLVGTNKGSLGGSYAEGDVTGATNAGGLVGTNEAGAETGINLHAVGTVSGTDNVGGLIGTNRAALIDAYATGQVTGATDVGGLVGLNETGANLDTVHATGAVTGVNGSGTLIGDRVGGLVGANSAAINNAQATGQVTGRWNAGGLIGLNNGTVASVSASGAVIGLQGNGDLLGENIGGLVGSNSATGTISAADATGQVNGRSYVGGLVGLNNGGTITNAHAAGTVNSRDGGGNLRGDYVGGLVGANRVMGASRGTISNAYATGQVSGATFVGGLVGVNDATIASAHATGEVSSAHTSGASIGNLVGGLVGYNTATGQIDDTFATGAVRGAQYTGGLVGTNSGALTNSYATGQVTGRFTYTGGLVGVNDGTIADANATGAVVGTNYVGGLVASNTGTISSIYATGQVTGTSYLGGLVGANTGAIDNARANGRVTLVWNGSDPDRNAGGLVGLNSGTIDLAYASGAVSGLQSNGDLHGENIGGLVGSNSATGAISNSHATGQVTGLRYVGGLAGLNDGGTIDTAYATGTVRSFNGAGDLLGDSVGGLVGANTVAGASRGAISNAYATGQVSGAQNVGGLVGLNFGGSIASAHATGEVSGADSGGALVGDSLGGLVGLNTAAGEIGDTYATGLVRGADTTGGLVGQNYGALSNSYAAGQVTAGPRAGGLVGVNEGTIENAYATGAVAGTDFVGGLVGLNEGTISSTYSTGHVTGNAPAVGGLVGRDFSANLITNSFWDTQTSGMTDSGGGVGLDTTQMMSTASLAGLDFTTDWFLIEGSMRPLLRSEYSTTITNAHQLQLVAMDLSASYTLGNDIDLSELTNPSNWGGSSGFAPIGDLTTAFTGSFDGAGYTIRNLYINRPSTDAVGLFGVMNGTVSTVALEGSSVTGRSYVGAFAGASSGTFGEVYQSGTVQSNGAFAGGLVGYNNGSIYDSVAAGVVTGALFPGGLVGIDAGTIGNSHYNIDELLLNGAHRISVGGLFDSQFQDWAANGFGLDIADYSASLSFDASSSSYLIGSIQGLRDLLGFADVESYRFTLAADIDLSSAPDLYIPSFTAASFDGAGHTLSNLSLNRSQDLFTGMFGTLGSGSTITGLTLSDVSVIGFDTVGGLVGRNFGTIRDSHVSGAIFGENRVGGLVGENGGSLREVSSLAQVAGGSSVGGLAGSSFGTIDESYASSVVNGGDRVGGLVGHNTGALSNVYATGTASSVVNAGGLVGVNDGIIQYAYATGAAGADSGVGGLVGINSGEISNTYSTSEVVGSTQSGGLVGQNVGAGTVTASFWDIDSSGQADQSDGRGTGRTGDEMMQSSTFSAWGSAISAVGGSTATWRIYEGYTNPLLRSFLTDVTLAVDNASATYNGAEQTFAVTYDAGSADTGRIYTSDAIYRNAGTQSLGSHVYSDQQGYDISYVGGMLDIARANLTISTSNVVKTYDGTTTAAGAAIATSGLVGSDTLSGGTFAFADRNAGTDKAVTVSGVTVNDGNGGNNYNITYANNTTSTIERANLSVSSSEVTKTYDGTTSAAGTAVLTQGTLFGSDALSGGAFAFVDRNAGTDKAVTVGGVTVDDGNGGNNYNITYTDNTTSTIERANLSISSSDVTKTYDGTTSAAGTAVATSGLVGGDTLSGGTFAFVDRNAGTDKAVTVSGVTVNDGNGGNNYNVTYADNTTSTIERANLSISSSDVTKTYDGTTSAVGTAVLTQGTLFGSDALSGGAFAFVDRNAGTDKAVTVGGVTVNDGNGGNNYSVTYADNTTSTIERANLSISSSDVTKTYDGTTSAAGTAVLTGGALFGSDTLSGGTFAFVDRNAGTDKAVTVGGVTVDDGNGGNNYNVTYADNTTSTIAQRALTYTTVAENRVYDGTTAAVVNLSGLTGLVGNETLTVTGTGAFNSKDVASANLITVTSATLGDGTNGGLASNYTIAAGGTAAASITPRALTYTATAPNRVYDGTTNAVVSLTGLTGLVGNETLTVSGTGVFNSRDVATANRVTVTTATLGNGVNGGLASNYSIAAGGTAAASITPASLTITAENASRLVGALDPAFNLTYRGFVAGETAATLTTLPTATTSADSTSPAGRYAITVSGAVAPNYSIAYVPGTLTVTDAYSLTGGLLGAMAYLGGFNDELFLEELSDGIPMASETHDGLLTIQDSGMRLPAGVH